MNEATNEFDNTITNERNDIENSIKTTNDTATKLELEKNTLEALISLKEKSITEMEHLVLQKLPAEFSNFEYIFKKELEIHNKMKTENNFLYSKNDAITKELREMIKVYKEVANIDIEKTNEGYLRISFFKNIKSETFPIEGGSLIVEIKENNFKIISIFPEIQISIFEKELQHTRNFTLFLAKIANEFLKLI